MKSHDMTCGACGRTWNSDETPAPAARKKRSSARSAMAEHHCDGCGKARKPFRILKDTNGDPEIALCFLCVKEDERRSRRDKENSTPYAQGIR